MTRLTFKKSIADILEYLTHQPGWVVHTRNIHNFKPLKVPYVTNPVGCRIEFHAQSVHYARKDGHHMLSLDRDLRLITPHGFESDYRSLLPYDDGVVEE